MQVDAELMPLVSGRRALMMWMLSAFLLTFLVTRAVTRLIRLGRGPFRDVRLGGVHVHHEVYGIFLLLGAGTAEFAYRPPTPWMEVLAVLFGVGAALTLDEFALWLHLDDVYWSRQGRSSVDAVFVALVVGIFLLIGANPFDADAAAGELNIAVTVVVNLLLALVAILKGRVVLGVIGVFVPLVGLVGTLRLARPASPWARRRYAPGSSRWRRSRARYPEGRRTRWDALVDLFAVVPLPARTAPPATPVPRSAPGAGDAGGA